MRFESFRIINFRGIEDAKLDLSPRGAGIFTLIGLNESGKTTILEAINSFSFDEGEEKSLYNRSPTEEDPSTFVPKHKKYNFSGDIEVVAVTAFEADEKEYCIALAEKRTGSKIDPDSVPDRFAITRGHVYVDSDKTRTISTWDLPLEVKDKGARKFREVPSSHETWKSFVGIVKERLPEIVYFPTFIFDQPDKIVLNPKEDETDVDRLYRQIIENIGSSLPNPISTKKHIVDRIVDPATPIEQFAGLFGLSDNKQQQIDSALEQLSSHLKDTIFDSWSKVFGQSFKDREVRLKLITDKFDDGSPRIAVQIWMRDGKQQYSLSERSLGFRWFFSFLLFTIFRSNSSRNKKTIFLLDEPASNLHSSAQTQLLDSFPRITSGGNILLYSTHSHYMISPEWLDQAFIVSNLAVDYDDTNSLPSAPSHTNIKVQKYRTFVGLNADKATYFQPVLDRLQVVPSRLDALQPSVLVEGKGDYLILMYGLKSYGLWDGSYSIIPTRGADGFEELAGIMLGWGVNFVLCFDDDKKGRAACESFRSEWCISRDKAFTLAEVHPSLAGKPIEGILSKTDEDLISDHYGINSKPSKSQIQLFFSEGLALSRENSLSDHFKACVESFDKACRSGLSIS
ncbi:hypothetical protein E4M02_02435 [Brevundimonas sp. S30B]|uniref:AAA family ATPase n=1 Tax=unclassified Brevundimonas TaxID=2622653 RepID=UPI001072D78A|nr:MULTISPECIES: AAA family ATPase [unclassified Brevundimonas]QBX37252.1 hypothetical protein E4M01_05385 [Brevundimonas sp. MF30-B]TFW03955.1 hypothetical protein E4M02_02435 [Brevundimonas sp. S30B]